MQKNADLRNEIAALKEDLQRECTKNKADDKRAKRIETDRINQDKHVQKLENAIAELQA